MKDAVGNMMVTVGVTLTPPIHPPPNMLQPLQISMESHLNFPASYKAVEASLYWMTPEDLLSHNLGRGVCQSMSSGYPLKIDHLFNFSTFSLTEFFSLLIEFHSHSSPTPTQSSTRKQAGQDSPYPKPAGPQAQTEIPLN